jgi:structural maintenance of chromosome 2
MRQSAKDQKKLLLKALGVDLTDLRDKYSEIYDERRMVGREMRTAKAKIGEKPDEKYFDKDEVSISELSGQIEEIGDQITKVQKIRQEISLGEESIQEDEAEIESLKERIKTLEEKVKQTNSEIKKSKSDLKKIDAEKLIEQKAELKEQIDNAENINEKIRQAQNYLRNKKEFEEKETEYNSLSDKLEKIEKDKEKKLAKANPPKGVEVTSDGLLYNNIPISQLSGAEKLRLSLEIATRIEKDLKVVRITDGSLLDEEGLKEVEKIANENDYQVWIEIVKNENDGVGIYLEDGQLSESKK